MYISLYTQYLEHTASFRKKLDYDSKFPMLLIALTITQSSK